MGLGLYEQAAALGASLTTAEQQSLEGDRVALEIRYGIIDRNTLRGPGRWLRLDKALSASDALVATFSLARRQMPRFGAA